MKMKQRLSLLLASVLIITALCGLSVSADSAPKNTISVYSGENDYDFWMEALAGSSTEITIMTADQLMAFADLTSTFNFAGWTIKLGADMVVNPGDASTWATTPPTYNWKCSTVWAYRFAGNFDGQGHVISGLYTKHGQECGLFGTVTGGNTIQNVTIVNSYFQYESQNKASDVCMMGGIVGYIDGWEAKGGYDNKTTTIKNVYVNATLYTDCDVPTPETDSSKKSKVGVAGIVGYVGNTTTQNLTIENAVFEGDLTSSYRNLAGIIGGISFIDTGTVTIKNCSVNANIKSIIPFEENEPNVGGLIGINNRATVKVENCVVRGTIEVIQDQRTGAFIGYVYANAARAITVSAKNVLLAVTPIPSSENEGVIFRAMLFNCAAGGDTVSLYLTLNDIKFDSSLYSYPTTMKHVNRVTDKGMVTNTDFAATGVATADLKGQAVFTGWTAVNGDYPVPAGVTIPTIDLAAYQNAEPSDPVDPGEGESTETTTEKTEPKTEEPKNQDNKTGEPTTSAPKTDAPAEKKGGCGSTVGIAGISALAIAAVIGAALFGKKEEN